MNGACATCAKHDTCFYSSEKVIDCIRHESKSETNYERLFGTPERAARTLIAVREECEEIGACYPNCPFRDAPACPSSVEPRDHDALLEWLRGDA